MQKAFSEILKEYQKKTGYSNAEMANVLGTSERMYAYYETGEYKGVLKKNSRSAIERLAYVTTT